MQFLRQFVDAPLTCMQGSPYQAEFKQTAQVHMQPVSLVLSLISCCLTLQPLKIGVVTTFLWVEEKKSMQLREVQNRSP